MNSGNGFQSRLVSMGLDGRIFIWTVNVADVHDFTPSKAYIISIEDLPKSLNTTQSVRREKESSRSSEVGITDASFTCENESLFAAGCVGGALFLCSLDQSMDSGSLSVSMNDKEFLNPVRMAYVPHRSSINSVQFSSKHNNLFLSSSVDGEIRVYESLDARPVALMHFECDKRSKSFWSQERGLIYCLTASGSIRSIRLSHESREDAKTGGSSKLYFDSNPYLLPGEVEEVTNLWPNRNKAACDEFAVFTSGKGLLSVWRKLGA